MAEHNDEAGNGESGDIVTCPTCQKIWPKDTKFCTQCGTWIHSGQVMESPTVPTAPVARPGQPVQGPSPPGIAPTRTGASPTAGAPGPGSAPPTAPGIGPPPPGFAAVQRSALDSGGIAPPPGQPGEAQEGEPPKKKYALKIEPPREERIPEGRVFIPQREPKKKQARIKLSQIPIIIICLLALAYAVTSIAFKPLHHYVLGQFFETIGKPNQALKRYQKVTTTYRGSSWADRSAKAMTRIGRKKFVEHLELQYYNNWTAESKITITPGGERPGMTADQIQLESIIAYKAPGLVVEEIMLDNGNAYGKKLINNALYGLKLGGRTQKFMSAAEYDQDMNSLLKFGPDTLFNESGKNKVLEAFFDDLELRLHDVQNDEELGRLYVYSLSIGGDTGRAGKFSMLAGPFVAWFGAPGVPATSEIRYHIRAEDGFLHRVEYMDASGVSAVVETFSEFEPGVDVSDSRFQPQPR